MHITTSILIENSAVALVFDMGLHQSPPKKSPNRSPFYEALREYCVPGVSSLNKTERTLEERRAFLGYYFLSSVYDPTVQGSIMTILIRSCSTSLFTRKTEPPQRYSAYVEDCVRALEEFGDHSNDMSAIALVRLQAILERVCIILCFLSFSKCHQRSSTVILYSKCLIMLYEKLISRFFRSINVHGMAKPSLRESTQRRCSS